jgi:hypothetical protein
MVGAVASYPAVVAPVLEVAALIGVVAGHPTVVTPTSLASVPPSSLVLLALAVLWLRVASLTSDELLDLVDEVISLFLRRGCSTLGLSSLGECPIHLVLIIAGVLSRIRVEVVIGYGLVGVYLIHRDGWGGIWRGYSWVWGRPLLMWG